MNNWNKFLSKKAYVEVEHKSNYFHYSDDINYCHCDLKTQGQEAINL